MKGKVIKGTALFPFHKVKPGSRVVIYGAGVRGESYINQICSTNYCDLVDVVDIDWESKKAFLVPVHSPASVADNKECVIVIAIKNKRIIHEAEESLLKYGIQRDQIVSEDIEIPLDESRGMLWDAGVEYILNDQEEKEWIERLETLKSTLRIMSPRGVRYIRVGNANDGGYVMSDFSPGNSGIAYSFGISDDVSWDKDMANRGYDVYMYDHTIDGLPEQHKRFHFQKIGVADTCRHKDNVMPLDELIQRNGHEKCEHMILKIDVEGAEYGVIELTDACVFQQFDQMVFEFHGFSNLKDFERKISQLNKLNQTHQVIHVHANNYGDVIHVKEGLFPDVLEVTYLKRNTVEFCEEDELYLPRPADAPCWKYREELALRNWNRL